MFHVDGIFLSYSMDPVNRYESVSKILLVDESIDLGFQLLRSTNNPSRFRNG